MSNQNIGERRSRKLREINAGTSLLNYVEKINSGEIEDFETTEVDLNQWNVGVNADDLKAEIQHCNFKIKQLIKNGRKTWYGK